MRVNGVPGKRGREQGGGSIRKSVTSGEARPSRKHVGYMSVTCQLRNQEAGLQQGITKGAHEGHLGVTREGHRLWSPRVPVHRARSGLAQGPLLSAGDLKIEGK